ncbi:MAG: DUF1003 domain-containing protein [Rhodobacteraceae bacterium]|jgi:uncharacterized membrane protein|nr:DUF1003 domain-containing protein [Paracoccaceae bacterium]
MIRRHRKAEGSGHICGRHLPMTALHPFASLHPGLSALMAGAVPGRGEGGRICHADLARLRKRYVEPLVETSRGTLADTDGAVIDRRDAGAPVSRQVADDPPSGPGDRAADAVAGFGGSCTFIGLFAAVMAVWVVLNAGGLMAVPFDPYPVILLNLMLSRIAAVQAPVIMMRQRRQETKDRARALNDDQVNLKAAPEIRQLHEKIDHEIADRIARLGERLAGRADPAPGAAG